MSINPTDMKETINTLEGIRDIATPAMPWQYALENLLFSYNGLSIIFMALIVTGLLAVILYLTWQRYFSVRGKAQRKITVLEHRHITQAINYHHTAFQISHILREALNIMQVSRNTPLPSKLHTHKERWHRFADNLSAARYSPAENTVITELLADARFWLRCWPRDNNA